MTNLFIIYKIYIDTKVKKIGEKRMKLPNMALIFAIIIIPISLIFSTYVGYQVSTVSKQTTYDTRLITATRDAIEALELNTFGDPTKDNATSTRRNIQASVNTFVNSFSSNFNISGYDNSDVLIYVPALLFTMYDGYYIYAPTTENQEDADGYSYNKHVLKPYIYYSARYKNDDKGYDVVINYSLDNYITITGKVNGKPVAKSGYLIDTSKCSVSTSGKVERYDGALLASETLYETLSFYEEDFDMNGYINADDEKAMSDKDRVIDVALPGNAKEPRKITLNCRYCYKNNQKYYYADGVLDSNGVGESPTDWDGDGTGDIDNYMYKWYTYDNTGHVTLVNENTAGLKLDLLNDKSAQNYYQEAYEFSDWVNETFPDGIHPNDMIKPDGTEVNTLINTDGSPVDDSAKDVYFVFAGDTTTNILNAVGEGNESAFNQHRLSVMQNSIIYNLNVAISNYSKASGMYEFALPEISESEWNKILTNISMVSFVQGMPIGFKIYNNYAIVTSTNNQMYVSDESIYYVVKPSDEARNLNKEHHAFNCSKIEEEYTKEHEDSGVGGNVVITGYPSTEFDMYTINYQTTGFIDGDRNPIADKDHYLSFYRHYSLDCYYCIVNRNSGDTALDEARLEMKRAKILASARIKYNQYKVTQYVNSKTDSSS